MLTTIFLCVLVACKKSEKIEKGKTVYEIASSNDMNKEGNWTVLFDGSSFEHWRGYLSENMYSEWTIEDSAMVFTPRGQREKNIITKKKYTNFVLSLEWNVSEAGNSGIFWGVYENKKFPEAYMTGPEIQILDNAKHPDSFIGNGIHKAGSLYDLIGYPEEDILPAGEWNLCVIKVDQNNNKAQVTLNGKTTISFPLQGTEWQNMVENSKFKDWEGFAKYRTGHIGLQDHGDIVSFRNIKIKEL